MAGGTAALPGTTMAAREDSPSASVMVYSTICRSSETGTVTVPPLTVAGDSAVTFNSETTPSGSESFSSTGTSTWSVPAIFAAGTTSSFATGALGETLESTLTVTTPRSETPPPSVIV